MDRLRSLAVFARVVETGSFSKCASEMGVGQSSISKSIDFLEAELGAILIHRTTRSLSLTAEGEKVLAEAKKVLDAYDELLAVSNLKSASHGVIRVTCPTALGSLYLIPRLRSFMRKYPQIQVRLQLTDSFLDLVESDIDVAFRVGEVSEGSFIAKRVGLLTRIAVAGDQYLAERGAPKNVDDLKYHDCITVGKSQSPTKWSGRLPGGQSFSSQVTGNFIADSHLALRPAVKSGMGIALAAKFVFEDGGELVKGMTRVLNRVEFQPLPLHILFKQNRNLPTRMRLFIDFFFDDLRSQPWLE